MPWNFFLSSLQSCVWCSSTFVLLSSQPFNQMNLIVTEHDCPSLVPFFFLSACVNEKDSENSDEPFPAVEERHGLCWI